MRILSPFTSRYCPQETLNNCGLSLGRTEVFVPGPFSSGEEMGNYKLGVTN